MSVAGWLRLALVFGALIALTVYFFVDEDSLGGSLSAVAALAVLIEGRSSRPLRQRLRQRFANRNAKPS